MNVLLKIDVDLTTSQCGYTINIQLIYILSIGQNIDLKNKNIFRLPSLFVFADLVREKKPVDPDTRHIIWSCISCPLERRHSSHVCNADKH